jgi:hypothetical protein
MTESQTTATLAPSVATITAYDSASPQEIPKDAEAVFPYADGMYAWSHTQFPHAYWRYITVEANPDVDICDYEAGAVFKPKTLSRWASERRKRGLDVTVYCDRDNYPAVAKALAGTPWHLFLATLDGTKPRSYKGKPCRAVQYTDRANAYDVSIVYDTAWMKVNHS